MVTNDELWLLDRALAPILVLAALTSGPSYPYEVCCRLRKLGFERGYSRPDLSPLFGRLAERGYLDNRGVCVVNNRARHYYALTESGLLAQRAARERSIVGINILQQLAQE
ncbi:MAG: PadR family transcriptional regulator [Actinobacteria bacterium]|nr:PadR family transcriptional regulator [Actinomycetota bacterium]